MLKLPKSRPCGHGRFGLLLLLTDMLTLLLWSALCQAALATCAQPHTPSCTAPAQRLFGTSLRNCSRAGRPAPLRYSLRLQTATS